MDVNSLVIYAKVVELQSFTRAARSLGLEKSTVSTKITHLESRLGLRLLNRTTRSVTATEAGEGYYRYCQQIVETANEAEQFVETLSEEPQGVLRVTAPGDFGSVLLESVFTPFLRDYPKVKLDLDLTPRMVDLVSERFDIAIRASQQPLRDSSLIAKKIVCIEMGFYASPEYIDQKGVPVTIRDFEHHEIISFINDESGLMVTKNGKSHVVQPNTRIKVNDILACREAAKSGLGVAVLPSLVVHNELQKSRLQEILSDYELPKATLYAVYPSRKWMPSKTKVFLDYLDGKKLLK